MLGFAACCSVARCPHALVAGEPGGLRMDGWGWTTWRICFGKPSRLAVIGRR